MKINKKQALYIGGCAAGGFVLGCALTPLRMVMAVIAPVSYPFSGIVQGIKVSSLVKSDTAKVGCILGGSILGIACIPLAPLHFVTAPVVLPLGMTAVGAFGGYSIYQDEIKKERQRIMEENAADEAECLRQVQEEDK